MLPILNTLMAEDERFHSSYSSVIPTYGSFINYNVVDVVRI